MKKLKQIAIYLAGGVMLVALPPYWVQKCYGELASGDVLTYTATIISILGTVIVAAITIVHERKQRKLEKEEEEKRRLNEILPVLSVRFRKKDDVLWVEMTNYKDSPALSVHIEDQFLFSSIKHEECKKRMVEFEASGNEETLYLYSLTERLEDRGYPERLTLYYMDVDRNTIEQEYVYDDGGAYCINKGYAYL